VDRLRELVVVAGNSGDDELDKLDELALVALDLDLSFFVPASPLCAVLIVVPGVIAHFRHLGGLVRNEFFKIGLAPLLGLVLEDDEGVGDIGGHEVGGEFRRAGLGIDERHFGNLRDGSLHVELHVLRLRERGGGDAHGVHGDVLLVEGGDKLLPQPRKEEQRTQERDHRRGDHCVAKLHGELGHRLIGNFGPADQEHIFFGYLAADADDDKGIALLHGVTEPGLDFDGPTARRRADVSHRLGVETHASGRDERRLENPHLGWLHLDAVTLDDLGGELDLVGMSVLARPGSLTIPRTRPVVLTRVRIGLCRRLCRGRVAVLIALGVLFAPGEKAERKCIAGKANPCESSWGGAVRGHGLHG